MKNRKKGCNIKPKERFFFSWVVGKTKAMEGPDLGIIELNNIRPTTLLAYTNFPPV